MNKEKLTTLEEQLLDEYLRCKRNIEIQERAINERCVRGYISKKYINNKEQYYLQHREGEKIVSQYIRHEDLPSIEKSIKRRKFWEESIRELKKNMKQIEKALGRKMLIEHGVLK